MWLLQACWFEFAIVMQVLHKHFKQSVARTLDADKAQLFFIPVYLGRYYNWYWQQWSTPGKPWEIIQDCEPRHKPGSPECWWEKWMWGKGVGTPDPTSLQQGS
jgi:hypothetical protein